MYLPRHPCIRRTLSLAKPPMPSDSSCSIEFTSARARVHRHRFADDQPVRDQFTDGLTAIGVRDLAGFVRIQPNLALAAANDRGREALLRA